MRSWMASILILCLAGVVAADTGNRYVPPEKDGVGDGMADTREGGESYADALVIPSLPYEDTGATCDNVDDIAPSCASSTAPDVVYAYTPASDEAISIDLCNSGFDTVLEIQDGVGTPVACNDDYCGLQSGIESFQLNAGHTYYFIVDGYGTSCGSYQLTVQSFCCCCYLECPPGGQGEGEPPCGDNYVDTYNGGCNSEPPVFQPIYGAADGTAILCGRSGTYSYSGWSYRDTDWFQVYGTGGELTATLVGEFDTQLIFIYGTDCINPQYDLALAACCEEVALSRTVAAGVEAWIWVGPAVFNGVSCDSDYLLELSGISPGGSPAGENTWGEIKSCFR